MLYETEGRKATTVSKNINKQIMVYDFSMGNELCFALFGRLQTYSLIKYKVVQI